MSNDWFQFRKFLIRQDQSAMKVGTDGVLLGAWANCSRDAYLRPFGSQQSAVGISSSSGREILDVGTGTGLVALMLAQRYSDACMTALEIDPAAAQQATQNVKGSLWADRIEVVQADFRNWRPPGNRKFDLIVSNPPFFSRSLKNPDIQRATARHDEDLPLSGLIPKAAELLGPEGKLSLILPADRMQEAMTLAAKNGIYLLRRMDIRGHFDAPVKRVLLEWGKRQRTLETSEMVIETGVRGEYTEEYRRLTGEFYLSSSFTP